MVRSDMMGDFLNNVRALVSVLIITSSVRCGLIKFCLYYQNPNPKTDPNLESVYDLNSNAHATPCQIWNIGVQVVAAYSAVVVGAHACEHVRGLVIHAYIL